MDNFHAFFPRRSKYFLYSCLFAMQTLPLCHASEKGSLILITNTNTSSRQSPAKTSAPTPFSGEKLKGEEALCIRRITEYWKDGDTHMARAQILNFLSHYPDSHAKDGMVAMLGDLYFQESRYPEASNTYDQIINEDLKSKVLFNHVQALFEMGNYAGVDKLASRHFQKNQKLDSDKNLKLHLFQAESLYRQMLSCDDPAQQQKLARLAKPHYKFLAKTTYEQLSLLPLAEIYRILKEYPRAAEHYQALSLKQPAKAEELLFQAAGLQVKYDKGQAIDTFLKICTLNGKRTPAAAYNLMVLLFQEKRYQDLISNRDLIFKYLPQEYASLMHFYLGRSYFDSKDYEHAAAALEVCVQAKNLDSSKLKTALLTAILCAENTRDLNLFDRNLKILLASFPQDPESPKALAKHAQLAFSNNRLKQAQYDLQMIFDRYPEYTEKENLLYDLALIQFMDKKWDGSRAAFLSFIEKYPESPKKNSAEKLALSASMQSISQGDQKDDLVKKENLIHDLKALLARDSHLESEEKRDCHFLLLKTLLGLNRFDETLSFSNAYIEAYQSHPSTADVHLFIALCHQKGTEDLSQFVEHAEKALEMQPAWKEHLNLHLQLYNACLKLVTTQGDSDKRTYSEKAAEHLYQAFLLKESSLKKENLLWLSNFYFQRAQENPNALTRAIELEEKILDLSDGETLKIGFFTPDSLNMETEVMKLAELLSFQNKPQRKISLLESLTHQQQMHPEYEWKFLRRSLFELAMAYESVFEQEKALQTYDRLIQTATYAASYLSNAASLQKARLQYALLKDEERNEDNSTLIEVLNHLKDLQIKKKLFSEPLHLEAALDYTDIRVSLTDAQSKTDRSLFFFKRLVEDFNSQKDLLSKDYNAAREVFPEKAAIFDSYMQYIQTEILKFEGILAIQNQETQKGQELKKEAETQFEQLLGGAGLTSYLRNRIENSLDEMKKTL